MVVHSVLDKDIIAKEWHKQPAMVGVGAFLLELNLW